MDLAKVKLVFVQIAPFPREESAAGYGMLDESDSWRKVFESKCLTMKQVALALLNVTGKLSKHMATNKHLAETLLAEPRLMSASWVLQGVLVVCATPMIPKDEKTKKSEEFAKKWKPVHEELLEQIMAAKSNSQHKEIQVVYLGRVPEKMSAGKLKELKKRFKDVKVTEVQLLNPAMKGDWSSSNPFAKVAGGIELAIPKKGFFFLPLFFQANHFCV